MSLRARLAVLVLAWLFVDVHVAAAAAPEALEGKKISALKFRGNRKTEAEAIKQNLSLLAGDTFSREKLREDVRAVWNMGYFDDIQVDAEEVEDGVEITWLIVEKPTIRKIYVAGHKEIGLDKINEVLDLRKDTILDLTKVKRNSDKIRELYVDKGYYLADVSYETRRINQNEIDVWFRVEENAKVEVRRVDFIGNEAVPTSELKSAMGTREGGWLSFLTSSGTYKEDAFERDILLLTAFYYDKGYLNVKFGRPEIELSADKRYLYITIPVDEGPQYKYGKIDVKGDLVVSREESIKRLTIKPGEIFNRSRLGADIIKLNDLYKDRGYAYVNVTPMTAIDNEGHTVDLTFDVQQGPKVFFERINIRGNVKTRDKVIRRELKIFEGELYNQTMLDLSKRRVQALGFFEKVEFSTRKGASDDKIEVNFEVTERPTGTFQVGAGFSSVENFIGQAQVSQNNLFGRGQTLALQAQISSLRQLFSLRFLDPYFLDTPLTFAFSVYNSLLYYPSFNRRAIGGDLTWGYLLSDNVRVFGTYKLEDIAVAPNVAGQVVGGFSPGAIASPGTLANLFRSGLTSSLRASITWDTRNDRLFPTQGVMMTASAEYAGPQIGSQNVFHRFTGNARFYHPIWGPIVFRTNIEAEFAGSYTEQGVPIYERYFLGGVNSVRGFQLFQLGPRILKQQSEAPDSFTGGFNIGGNLKLVGNFEIEFPIFPQVQIKGVVFFDVGNAYNTEQAWCDKGGGIAATGYTNPCAIITGSTAERFAKVFTNLRLAAGFGFRWFSPIGPLRFEWGIPIGRLPNEDPIVFQFTIGSFF